VATSILGDNMTFGKWLKIKLRQNKVQQKELAKKINVAENTITSWVTDLREPSTPNFIWLIAFIAKIEDVPEYEIYNEASTYF
jgi:transcriptional regulator with XRE-family HTH domain